MRTSRAAGAAALGRPRAFTMSGRARLFAGEGNTEIGNILAPH